MVDLGKSTVYVWGCWSATLRPDAICKQTNPAVGKTRSIIKLPQQLEGTFYLRNRK